MSPRLVVAGPWASAPCRHLVAFPLVAPARSAIRPRFSSTTLPPPARRLASTLAPLTEAEVKQSLKRPHLVTTRTAQQLQLPAFTATNDQVELLDSPAHFYQTLKDKIASAQTRIFLTSLYIGKEELELVEHLRSTLRSKPALRLTILTDALRSTRETSPRPSSAALLATLSRDFPDQVDLRLYHTPSLKGLTKRLVGKRFNEGWGLQHMKIYGFDDDVIISGANLSRDYFTNRKDRYVLLKRHRQLSNYLQSLVLLAARFSYSLTSTEVASSSSKGSTEPYSAYRLDWDGGDRLLLGEEPDGSVAEGGIVGSSSSIQPLPEQGWSEAAQAAVEEFTRRWHQHTLDTVSSPAVHDEAEIVLVPLLQMGPLRIRQETTAVPQVFHLASSASAAAGRPALLDLTSGYFSLHPPYKALLSAPSRNEVQEHTRIICAAPESNGFFQSKGVSGWIPEGYTWFEHKFWAALKRNNRLWKSDDAAAGGVEIREWKKDGWTYHAKGIWYTPPGASGPTLFHVGSSNYGSRSSDLDLECTLLVSTSSPSARLSQRLEAEVEGLRADARERVDEELFRRPERKVRWRVRIAAWLIGGML